MKSVYGFILTLLLFTLSASASIRTVTAQNSTEVSGIITSDTIWTQENSPYILTGPTLISEGTTLTIEPGATVNLVDYYIVVNGTFRAQGNNSNKIYFTSEAAKGDLNTPTIRFWPTSTNWNEQTGSGSIIENAIFDSVGVSMSESSPKINNNTFGGGYFGTNAISVSSESIPIISNNIIDGTGGQPSTFSAGINCGGEAYIFNNIISGWSPSGVILGNGSPVLERNLIVNNTGGAANGGGGIRIDWAKATPIIRNNTIAQNKIGINLLNGPSPVIVNNNIVGNTEYNVYLINNNAMNNPQHDVNIAHNWWGTTDISTINQSMYDFKRDYNLGKVNFVPILSEPNPDAPAISPLPEPEPVPEPEPSDDIDVDIDVDVDVDVGVGVNDEGDIDVDVDVDVDVKVSTEPKPKLTISIDSLSEPSTGVNIHGRLIDENGNPMENEEVTAFYSVSDSNWVKIGSSTTNKNGEYSIPWDNTERGTFTLKAEWNGNEQYDKISATTTISFLPQIANNFFIESNSTVTALTFNKTKPELIFTVTGPSGTTGYVKATIPKDQQQTEDDWTVLIDDNPIIPTIDENADKTCLHFTYNHSTHTIKIVGKETKPEFPSWIILPLVLAVMVVATVYIKKLHKKPNQQSY